MQSYLSNAHNQKLSEMSKKITGAIVSLKLYRQYRCHHHIHHWTRNSCHAGPCRSDSPGKNITIKNSKKFTRTCFVLQSDFRTWNVSKSSSDS